MEIYWRPMWSDTTLSAARCGTVGWGSHPAPLGSGLSATSRHRTSSVTCAGLSCCFYPRVSCLGVAMACGEGGQFTPLGHFASVNIHAGQSITEGVTFSSQMIRYSADLSWESCQLVNCWSIDITLLSLSDLYSWRSCVSLMFVLLMSQLSLVILYS